jgi:hypothetical protein
MPHNNLSDALLRLSEAKLTTEKEKEDLRTCLLQLASLSDTDYKPNSMEMEMGGLDPMLSKKLDEVVP